LSSEFKLQLAFSVAVNVRGKLKLELKRPAMNLYRMEEEL
jgi:hypothetical protein